LLSLKAKGLNSIQKTSRYRLDTLWLIFDVIVEKI